MKPKHLVKRGLALLLCASMLTCVFTGCSSKKSEEESYASATPVSYNNDGTYTTTITLTNMKFKNSVKTEELTVASAASVIYADDSADKTESATSNNDTTGTDTTSAEGGETVEMDIATLMKSNVAIKSAEKKDDTTLEVTFKDEDASVHVDNGYYFTIPAKFTNAKEDTRVLIPVDTEKVISCDTAAVTPDSKEIKLTFTLENENFASDVSADDLKLTGSFESMKINSLSSANKNLTVQLTGDLAFNTSSGCYTDGFVTISKDGIENAYTDTKVSVAVRDIAAYVNTSTLAFKDDVASVELVIYSDSFKDTAAASDFTIDGAKVTGFTKKDATTGVVSFTVDGAASVDAIAEAITDKELNVATTALTSGRTITTTLSASQAYFYPVYDYAEEADGKYTITLKMYSFAGSFSSDFSEKMISFGGDFKDAKITSLKKESDTVAELIISVASDNVSVENMNLNGTVILATGALTNEWKTAAKEAEYTRIYTYSEMGRDLSDGDISAIKDIVGGFGNTTFGTITGVISGGSSVASGVITILEMAGVVESQKAKLDKIYDYMTTMHSDMQRMFDKTNDMIGKVQAEIYATRLREFDEKLNKMINACDYCVSLVTAAGAVYTAEHAKPIKDLEYDSNGACTSSQALQNEWVAYCQGYLSYVRNNMNIDNKYANSIQEIEKYIVDIKSALETNSGTGTILSDFDTFCSLTYNFDVQSIAARNNFRTTIQSYLVKAKAVLTAYYLANDEHSVAGIADGVSLKSDMKNLNAANKVVADSKVTVRRGAQAQEIMYMYVTGEWYIRAVTWMQQPEITIKSSSEYISCSEFIRYNKAKVLGFNNYKLINTSTPIATPCLTKFTTGQATSFVTRMGNRTVAQELRLIDPRLGIADSAMLYFYTDDLAFATKGTAAGKTPTEVVNCYGPSFSWVRGFPYFSYNDLCNHNAGGGVEMDAYYDHSMYYLYQSYQTVKIEDTGEWRREPYRIIYGAPSTYDPYAQ